MAQKLTMRKMANSHNQLFFVETLKYSDKLVGNISDIQLYNKL